MLDHLKRALAFTKKDTGAHGLPLLGFAMERTVNLPTGAESSSTRTSMGLPCGRSSSFSRARGEVAEVETYRRTTQR